MVLFSVSVFIVCGFNAVCTAPSQKRGDEKEPPFEFISPIYQPTSLACANRRSSRKIVACFSHGQPLLHHPTNFLEDYP
jgi:hypothetical protein